MRDLEEGRLGLAESLGRYEEGIKLLKQCYTQLEQAERRIELLTGFDAGGKSSRTAIRRPSDSRGRTIGRSSPSTPRRQIVEKAVGRGESVTLTAAVRMDEPGCLF